MGAWVKRAGLLLGNELTVGAPSASALSASGSTRSSDRWDTTRGTFLRMSCVESILDSVDGLSANVKDAPFMGMVRSSVVPNNELPPPVGPIDRLGPGTHIVTGNIKSIVEVSCRLSNRADAVLFMTSLIPHCLVRKNAALALVFAARDQLVSSMRAKGAATKDAQDLYQRVTDMILGCEEVEVSTDPVDPEVTAGGSWTANNLSEDSSVYSGELPPQFFNWQSFKSTRADGHYVLVEMIDKDLNLRSITRAGGFVVRGLRLQMSPSTLTMNSVKLINRGQTLAGWVEEHWGDDLDQVTFSGKSLSFVAEVAGRRTLLVDSRADSAAYLEMQALIDIYKTNGLVLYDADPPDGQERKFYGYANSSKPQRVIAAHPMRGMVKERFYVRITFDFVTVIGYFESFELVERAETPYAAEYNLSFKAEQTIYH